MESTDYKTLLRLIARAMPQTHQVIKLGEVESLPIVLLTPKVIRANQKRVLIVAGFHGKEIAGPWGITRFITSGDLDRNQDVAVSLIPVINPDAFTRGTRYNRWNEISNHHFTGSEKEWNPSREGKILIENLSTLLNLAHDGFLSGHENEDFSQFYFYMIADKRDEELRKKFIDIGGSKFGVMPDGEHETPSEGKYFVKDGCVWNHYDDSFEQLLFDEGVPICITLETPMSNINLHLRDRIEVQRECMNAFISHIDEKEDWAGGFISSKKAVEDKPLKFDSETTWGFSVSIDMHNCDPATIRDPLAIQLFITKFCQVIDSIPYGPPQLLKFGKGDKYGHSFVQLVTTSSITGHFAEESNKGFIDAFYCKSFDPQKAVDFCREYFKCEIASVRAFTRD